MSDKKLYSAPSVTTLGTIEELTQMPSNKVGSSQDTTQPVENLVGSLVPAK